jgi:hypothetical protein
LRQQSVAGAMNPQGNEISPPRGGHAEKRAVAATFCCPILEQAHSAHDRCVQYPIEKRIAKCQSPQAISRMQTFD